VVCVGSLLALPVAPNGRWEILAAIAGAALGLALEYRFVDFTPTPVSPAWAVGKLFLGFGVAGVLFFAARNLEDTARLPAVALVVLAALWAFLGAPALFARLPLLVRQPPARAVVGQVGPR
jgi:hypothetical protein